MKNNLNLRKNENGQILILGGLLALVVVVFGYMLLNVGRVTEERINLQNTADTAAFAAAESQANTISSMGWLNQAMGTVYYYMASHAANVTVESTKMAFVHQAYNGSNDINTYNKLSTDKNARDSRNSILPSGDFEYEDGMTLGSLGDVVDTYDKAYTDAYTMIPRGEIWLWQMAKIQRGLAYIAPLMAEKEVYLAIKDKAARAAIFPKFKMYVDPANNFDLEIHKIYEVGLKTGWDMAANPGNLSLFVERDDNDSAVPSSYDTNPLADDPEIWKVTLRYKLQPSDPAESELYILSKGKRPPKFDVSEYQIYGTFTGWDYPGKTVLYDPSGVTTILGNGDSVTITNNPDGSTTIKGGTTNMTYRRNGNTFEVANKSGGWDSMGEVSTTIDGVEVKVTTNFSISLGDVTIVDPNHYVIGNTHIEVYKDDIDISTQIGRARVQAEKGNVIVNGLATKTADGKWHRPWEGSWTDSLNDQGGDTVRHRMLVIDPTSDWKYELREIGSYTQEEDDNTIKSDGRYAIRNGANYALSREGKTKDQINWLGYPSEQDQEIKDDKFTAKWYDLSKVNSGKPKVAKETVNGVDKEIEFFHLVAKCWNPLCIEGGSVGCYPVHYKLKDSSGVSVKDNNGSEIEFDELEMCRICYDNHRKSNNEKRKVKFGEPDVNGKVEFPDLTGIDAKSNIINIEVNGRIVVWSDYDENLCGKLSNYEKANFEWERTGTGINPKVSGLDKTLRPANRSIVFESNEMIPTYIVDVMNDKTGKNFPLAEMQSLKTKIKKLPWDMDHDDNGVTDVIMYPSDSEEAKNRRNTASWFYMDDLTDVEDKDYLKSMQNIGLSTPPAPMVLSEDFFKYGINVAVTSDKYSNQYSNTSEKRFLGLENQDKGKSNTPILTSIGPTNWGMMAMASARSAFWLESNGTGSYIFSPGDVDWSKDAEYAQSYQEFRNNTLLGLDGSKNFAYDDSINFEPQNEYRMRRQFFVKRHRENLYTSDWVAKLVPLKFAVRKDDLDLSAADEFDSSARYIYYNLMRTEWRESYIKTSGWKPPENMTLGPKGPTLTTSNTDIEAIFTH